MSPTSQGRGSQRPEGGTANHLPTEWTTPAPPTPPYARNCQLSLQKLPPQSRKHKEERASPPPSRGPEAHGDTGHLEGHSVLLPQARDCSPLLPPTGPELAPQGREVLHCSPTPFPGSRGRAGPGQAGGGQEAGLRGRAEKAQPCPRLCNKEGGAVLGRRPGRNALPDAQSRVGATAQGSGTPSPQTRALRHGLEGEPGPRSPQVLPSQSEASSLLP